MDQLFLSHHEVLKGLLVKLLNGPQNPSIVEQVIILILNVGSGTHRSKMMILEWEEFMKFAVERLRVSHATKCSAMNVVIISTHTAPVNVWSGSMVCVSTPAVSSGRDIRVVSSVDLDCKLHRPSH